VDELKGLALGIVFLCVIPIVALAYAAIAKNPRRWWLWLAVGSFPVIVAGALLGPLVFEPAFNKFTPLRDKQLEQKILDLAEKAGIPSRKVLEANKSAQTKKFNAYVSGFGASQRIVLWDTILEGMGEDEILFVMGHEMGHYVLAHVWKGIVVTVIVCALFFYLSYLGTRWAIARFGGRWGFTELSDVASMPLLVATISLISFVAQPMTNTFSRYIEHEADTFGLEVTRLSDAGARAFIKLGSQNKSNPEPNPMVKAFIYTHPPLIERIRYAQEYRPWEAGKPNAKYRGN
jgi:Zn-dependent protease with chaperone function